MATLSLENIRKTYGKTEVVHGISLDVEEGEFVVIVGPSGCGKSTLLRMVAGLETITAGELRIGGERVNEREPMDRDIAMVFQNYALYPHMTVFENMAYGLRIARTPRAEIDRRVRQAAEMLQLEPYLARRPRELSGGQRQRVAMGRAIVRKPRVFLFDEPLSNLDAKLRVQMRLEIRALQRELGVTALYVTHDQVEAMTLADRMVVMNGGHAEQIGAPLEVYRAPNTTFVAGFIGSPPMNLLPGASLGHPAPLVGLRPEHLRVGAPARLTATVRYAEALGAETLIHMMLDGGSPVCLRIEGQMIPPEVGVRLPLVFDDADLCLFGADGQRLPQPVHLSA
ncbi:sn-glycerol-3-phosphate ABC transporter ATP-binding protein UgpC [Halodurantibacterium flavum]|uniref:Sn-glycerol-3-phosphate ABC transporter ATP-binding protein UgpC n=1 Tax=Halodurantibacterium flavum TaxID=1382802 RepID=A0ABW4S021_9RHOB